MAGRGGALGAMSPGSVRVDLTTDSFKLVRELAATAPEGVAVVDAPVTGAVDIPGDAWEAGCATDTLFRAPEVVRFIADCLEIGALYCYDDPLAGLTANICDPGQQFTWHFDTNDFAVTVLVQPDDEGGLFEYVPQIRSAHRSFLVDRGDNAASTRLEALHVHVGAGRLHPH